MKKGMKVSFKEFKAPDPSGETTQERNGRAMEGQDNRVTQVID